MSFPSIAGNTLIRSLRWRSGREHVDLELAVEVPAEERESRRKQKEEGGRRKEEAGSLT